MKQKMDVVMILRRAQNHYNIHFFALFERFFKYFRNTSSLPEIFDMKTVTEYTND